MNTNLKVAQQGKESSKGYIQSFSTHPLIAALSSSLITIQFSGSQPIIYSNILKEGKELILVFQETCLCDSSQSFSF